MKKFILALMATFMVSLAVNAQTVDPKIEPHLKSSMCLLVIEAKTVYKSGATYDEWKYELFGENLKVPKEQEELLQDVYGFLLSGASPEVIYEKYDGKSLLKLVKFKVDGGEIVTSQRCGFWCLLWKLILIALEAFYHYFFG